jgi:hypothetical protein
VQHALQAFKQRNQPDGSFEAQFADCTPLQQGVLVEVAAGAHLFARDIPRTGCRVPRPCGSGAAGLDA